MIQSKKKYSFPLSACAAGVLVSALLYSNFAFAAEGAHEETAQFSDLFWPVVNFVLYVAILGYILKKPFASAWKTRRTSILHDVDTAKEESRVAAQLLAAQTDAFSTLEAKCKEVSVTIAEDAKREASQMLQEATHRSQIIAKQMEESVRAEEHQAEVSLRREISMLALDKAQDYLKTELTPEVDRALRAAIVPGIRQLAQ